MWIKASGTWLANATEKELFVPVNLEPLLAALAEGDPRAEKSIDFVNQPLNENNLRPSIETTVHAVLPQKVVVHIHCVDTIALAVQANGEQQLNTLLDEFNWLWVPYCRPGLPLSKSISAHLAPDTNVLVLGNHGLVVAADTVNEAAVLLERVRAAVKQEVRTVSACKSDELKILCKNLPYAPSPCPETHAMAMDEHAVSMATGGSMYPDHVIFLGAGTQTIDTDETANAVADQLEAQPPTVVVPGFGVLMHKEANASQHAMARCLSDVCLRMAKPASIRYLSADEEYQLLNWEAETYRQSIAT